MKRFVLLLGLLLLPVTTTIWAQDAAELEVDHNVNSEFTTPHTDWATPYALGKTRVLFFVRGHGTDPREVIELKQRFDLDPQMVFWARVVDSTQEGWHGAENGLRRMSRLLDQKWDAFVFLGIPLERLPTEQQYKLLKAVIGGAGLVFVGSDDKRVLKPQNAIKPLPPELAAAGGDPFRIKNGRGVRLPAQPSIAYRPGWETDYDYWQARLGRVILWAAGKAPVLQLAATTTAADVARATLPAPLVSLSWQAPAAAGALRWDCALRRADGWTQKLPASAVSTADGAARVTIPVLRAGAYHLDAIARSSRGVEDFATVPFAVTSPRLVTGLTLDRDWGEIGEKLAGKIACAGDLSAADERLQVSLFDRRGRELMRQVVGPVTTSATFAFPIEDWLPMLVRVQATLVNGTGELASAWQFAKVTQRHRGQYNFVMWDVPGGTLAPYGEESLARNGVTVHLTGTPAPPAFMSAYDIAYVPYTTRILAERDADGVMKPACWNDEAMIQAHVDAIARRYVPARQHGVFVYSLGDEGDVRGSCLSPQCLAAYQRYLEGEYGDIKALNASWGTSYPSFDTVKLGKPDDNDEREAFRTGNYPRWFDRQAYQSYNFCKLCERFGKGFRTIDPQSRCGFEGAGTFGAADDLDGFVRSNTFWSPYPGTADEVVRSIAPAGLPALQLDGLHQGRRFPAREVLADGHPRDRLGVVVALGLHRPLPRLALPQPRPLPGGQGDPARYPDRPRRSRRPAPGLRDGGRRRRYPVLPAVGLRDQDRHQPLLRSVRRRPCGLAWRAARPRPQLPLRHRPPVAAWGGRAQALPRADPAADPGAGPGGDAVAAGLRRRWGSADRRRAPGALRRAPQGGSRQAPWTTFSASSAPPPPTP